MRLMGSRGPCRHRWDLARIGRMEVVITAQRALPGAQIGKIHENLELCEFLVASAKWEETHTLKPTPLPTPKHLQSNLPHCQRHMYYVCSVTISAHKRIAGRGGSNKIQKQRGAQPLLVVRWGSVMPKIKRCVHCLLQYSCGTSCRYHLTCRVDERHDEICGKTKGFLGVFGKI